jgi:SAM-dependent methyltransferase
MRAYYQARAGEYDDWWLGRGLYADRDRPGWHEEVEELCEVVRGLAPGRVLDVACGTGFLTQHLRGEVAGLDQSPAMVAAAAERLPGARVVQGDAVPLPFAEGEFDRIFTGHFYGHLLEGSGSGSSPRPAELLASWWWWTRRFTTASTPRSGRSAS